MVAEAHAATLENVEVLNRYYDEVWNQGDLTVLDQFVSDDLVAHDPALGTFGFEQLRQLVGMFHSGFPDYCVTAEDIVAQGDRVALRFHSEGSFLGEFMGSPPTGKRISVAGLVMYRFRARKIAELWMGWDPASLLQQIGANREARPHSV